MKWVTMNMLAMDGFRDASFDVVLDKATMDALMVDEVDVWDPNLGLHLLLFLFPASIAVLSSYII
jgi:hypothetical protein